MLGFFYIKSSWEVESKVKKQKDMIEQVDSEEFSEGDSVFVQNYRNSHKCTEELFPKNKSYIILH